MKYIKLFEAEQEYEDREEIEVQEFYWQVNTKQPYFKFALKKIGMEPEEIESWERFFDNSNYDVYMFKRITEDGEVDWSWSELSEDTTEDCIFMGKVEVGDWEIEADKYNL